MNVRKTLVSFCIAAGAAVTVSPAIAAVDIYVRVAPPAPRYEAVPALEPGWAWAPGYWNWNGHRYVWVNGHRVHARHGYHWVPDRWAENHGRWHHDHGHWDRG